MILVEKLNNIRKFHGISKTKKLLFFVAFIFLVFAGYSLFGVDLKLTPGIRSASVDAASTPQMPAVITLSENELENEYTSPVFKTDFTFNAIAPHWQEKLEDDEARYIKLRVSDDAKNWSQWIEMELGGPLRDNDPYPDRVFPETPLFLEGRYVQYRFELNRGSLSEKAPEIKDLKINYIDSKQSIPQKIISGFKEQISKVYASSHEVNVISREEWGSPDPYGDKFKGTDRYWYPTYSPTKQVFLHHTVTESIQTDAAATVRAIWDFHANTRLWGDIGYNYIIDYEGNVYEGRTGGDNVTAGHVRDYNRGSLGVSILGCFQPDSSVCNDLNNGNTTEPTSASIESLTSLLSWKMTGFEIDPTTTQDFCDYAGENCLNVSTIAAHRDAALTECNGQLFYDMLPQIREGTATKKNQNSWVNSAKQEYYFTVDLASQSLAESTLSFKNTGTETWSNTDNPLRLKTANPDDRLSIFQGSDWSDQSTLATLNEATVAPGETGTFTFELVRPDEPKYSSYFEGLRLVKDDGTEFGNMFTVPIDTLRYESLSEPRSLRLITDTYKVNLYSHQYTGAYLEEGQIIEFSTKARVNGKLYLRSTTDTLNGYHLGIPLALLQELPQYEPLAIPRELRLTENTYKSDLFDLSDTGAQLEEGEIIKFDTKTKIDGELYLRSSYDTSKNYHRGLPFSLMQELPKYESLAKPRQLELVRDTRRTDLFTLQPTGGTLSEGRQIYFDTKTYINGKWYLRSSYDTVNEYHRGIPFASLREL